MNKEVYKLFLRQHPSGTTPYAHRTLPEPPPADLSVFTIDTWARLFLRQAFETVEHHTTWGEEKKNALNKANAELDILIAKAILYDQMERENNEKEKKKKTSVS